MDPEKFIEITRKCKQDTATLSSYITDLQSWENNMKRKEAALSGEFDQDLPPVRTKIKKERPLVKPKKKPDPRIPSSDYKAWDKFDVDKACEEVDMADLGPPSLDSKKSKQDKLDKMREEAQFEKERGNSFVKQKKWNEAISCYNRAIELVKDDAIYFANRGLCHLMNNNFNQSEKDCSEALRLDSTYVKAYQRRASAREKLGSLKAACEDLNQVLSLEPHNVASKKQLAEIKARMGSKGPNIKSSQGSSKPKTINIEKEKKTLISEIKVLNPEVGKWMNGEGENVSVIKPVKKPPNLRCKRPLKTVPIEEIEIGKTAPEKTGTRMKIIEIDSLASGDHASEQTNNESPIKNHKTDVIEEIDQQKDLSNVINQQKDLSNVIDQQKELSNEIDQSKGLSNGLILESDKIVKEMKEKDEERVLEVPANSVRFMAEWKRLKGNDEVKSDYLSIIDPEKIPTIFANSLESDILSDVLKILNVYPAKFERHTVTSYLRALVKVQRFSTLVMFLSSPDKLLVNNILDFCQKNENCPEDTILDLKNKFEL